MWRWKMGRDRGKRDIAGSGAGVGIEFGEMKMEGKGVELRDLWLLY